MGEDAFTSITAVGSVAGHSPSEGGTQAGTEEPSDPWQVEVLYDPKSWRRAAEGWPGGDLGRRMEAQLVFSSGPSTPSPPAG